MCFKAFIFVNVTVCTKLQFCFYKNLTFILDNIAEKDKILTKVHMLMFTSGKSYLIQYLVHHHKYS